jgi:xanthine dehydrogenase accessory factor
MTSVVQAIRMGGLAASAPAPPVPVTAVDPICGMTVLITPDALRSGDHYFCGPGCLARYTGS